MSRQNFETENNVNNEYIEDSDSNESELQKPEFLNNIDMDEPMKKTNDIINQLNEYIDNEKNNLK